MKVITEIIRKKLGPSVEKIFKQIRSSYVKAGIMGSAGQHKTGNMTNAQLASIHEFGLGRAPPRPFIRPPFDVNKQKYLKALKSGYTRAFRSEDPEKFKRTLGLIGQAMAADIKNYVTQGSGVPPPLAPSTIKRKGSSRPLVDTGQMINSVTYEVVWNGPVTEVLSEEEELKRQGIEILVGKKGGKYYLTKSGKRAYLGKRDASKVRRRE